MGKNQCILFACLYKLWVVQQKYLRQCALTSDIIIRVGGCEQKGFNAYIMNILEKTDSAASNVRSVAHWNLALFWLIDWIEFYAVLAIFQPCNGGDHKLNVISLALFSKTLQYWRSKFQFYYTRFQFSLHNWQVEFANLHLVIIQLQCTIKMYNSVQYVWGSYARTMLVIYTNLSS